MILSQKKEQDVVEYCRSISKFLRNDDLSRNFEKFLLRRKLKQNTETHKSDIFDVGITITNRKNQEKKTFLVNLFKGKQGNFEIKRTRKGWIFKDKDTESDIDTKDWRFEDLKFSVIRINEILGVGGEGFVYYD